MREPPQESGQDISTNQTLENQAQHTAKHKELEAHSAHHTPQWGPHLLAHLQQEDNETTKGHSLCLAPRVQLQTLGFRPLLHFLCLALRLVN